MPYRRVDGVLSEISDGRAMLSSPAGNEVLVLNETGTAVWEALAEEGDATTIARRIQDRHPAITAEAIEADVRGFLTQLEAEALIEGE